MKPHETIAVSKAITSKIAKTAREQLDPGEYPIDVAVQVQGTIKVGEDGEKKPTSSVLNKTFLALVLHYAGITREQAMAVIEQASDDILSVWHGTDIDREYAADTREQMVKDLGIDKALAAVDAKIDALPKIPVKGRVTTKLSVTQLDPTAEQDADDLLGTGTEGK